MTPQEYLKNTLRIQSEMTKALKMSTDVGLINAKVGSQIYGDGVSVMVVGAIHEYGAGNVPERSFLRAPFLTQQGYVREQIIKEWASVMQGKSDASRALGRLGVIGTNLAKGAFTSNGYGTWPAIKASTIKAKGSSRTLIDTGTLRNAITWQVNA